MSETETIDASAEWKNRRLRNRGNTLQAVVGHALDGRRDGHWPVSVAETVNRVRTAMPECDLTDDELADLVTISATERGLTITFDRDLLEAGKAGGPLFA